MLYGKVDQVAKGIYWISTQEKAVNRNEGRLQIPRRDSICKDLMKVTVRRATTDDGSICGAICYAAFKAIADRHNFPPDFPEAGVATGLLSNLIAHPGFYGVVAEVDGKIVGSNFLDERSTIAGIGPITIDPARQDSGTGRALMEHVLGRV